MVIPIGIVLSDGNASRFRRILPQVIVTNIKNLLSFDTGLALALPAVLIPALSGLANEHNAKEYLSVTPTQATWIGSIIYFFQPIGCALSPLLSDKMGRKKSMIIVNIPLAIGWLMIYQADAIWKILVGCATLGLALGFKESPVVTFVGEICEASTRGILISLSNFSTLFGILTMYTLNTLFPFRTIGLICLTVPIITAFALFIVPETPQWLLSVGKEKEAENALRWLRGWVSKEAVAEEFSEMQRHSERTAACPSCTKQNLTCTHPSPTFGDKLRELKRKQTMKPFTIVLLLFIFNQFTGVLSMRPFLAQIFKAYKTPIAPDKAMVVMSSFDNVANLLFLCLVHFTGKRIIYLTSTAAVSLSALGVACFGFICLPSGYVSFHKAYESFELQNEELGYISMILLFVWGFFSQLGLFTMPWNLLSEIFPFRSRSFASGFVVAINSILSFLTKRTYYDVEMLLSLPGVALLYSITCGVGFIVMLFIFPETEGISLEDIELHFSDNSKSLTDHKITTSKQTQKDVSSA